VESFQVVYEVKPLQIHIELLVPYNRIAKTQSVKVEMEGNSLDRLIEALIKRIPALEEHLTGEEIPGASPFLLLINGKVVQVEKQSEVLIKPGDRVSLTRIVAGG
jgi:molybdopterin converting factor small subunit